MTAPAIKAALDAAANAASQPLANMYEGCFKPEGRSQRGDCADGACYCARVSRHAATAAVAAFLRRLCEADAAVIARHGHDASIYGRGLERLAAAVEQAAEGGE